MIDPTVSGTGTFTLGYTSIGNDGLFVAGSCTTFSYENSVGKGVPTNLANPIGGHGAAYKTCISACNGSKVVVNMDILNSTIHFGANISGTGSEISGETVIGNEGATILGCGNKGDYENTFSTKTAPVKAQGQAGHTTKTPPKLTRPSWMTNTEWAEYQQSVKNDPAPVILILI